MKRSVVLLMILLALSCRESKQNCYDLVIHNVTVFDGNNSLGIVDLAISGDTIASIGKSQLPGYSVIDGSGKYIIPGLVNGHAHIWDLSDLQESYNAGVTTVLILHEGDPAMDQKYRLHRDSSGFANVFSAGRLANVEKGHPTRMKNPEVITDSLSIVQFVDNRINNGADLIKVVKESYNAYTYIPHKGLPEIPSLSYEQVRMLIEYSHERGLKCVVHISQLEDALQIARYRPDGFAHIWYWKDKLKTEDIKVLKEASVFIIPTALQQKIANKAVETDPTYTEERIAYEKEHFLYPDEEFEKQIFELYEARIPLIAGTDPPNQDVNYGTDLVRELEIYQDAGMPLKEVLKTATGNAANYLPIQGNGSLKIGNKATFLMLNSDPLKDLSALKDIASVWKNGKTR